MPRPRLHLTNAAVLKLPTPTLPEGMARKAMGAAVRDYFDRDVTGYHVRVSPTGRKTFALVYAMRDTGKRRRYTIGDFPTLNADDARALARARLAEAASGVDPQKVRAEKREAAAHTVSELVKAFLADAKRRVRPSTLALYERLLNGHILKKKFGERAVVDVTTADIARLHSALSGKATTANQCVRLLSTIFRYAERIGSRPRGTNPASDVPRYKEHLKERYLQPQELAALIRALDTAETLGLPAAPHRQREYDEKTAKHAPPPKPGKKNIARGTVLKANPVAVAALRLLMLTGARKSEVLSLKWSDVDLSAGVMILADSKTGRSVRPLSPPAVAVLQSVRRVVGSPYVFTSSATPPRPIRDPSRLWDAVRHAAKLDDMRLHDLRHTAASLMLQSGATLAEVGRSLGHASARTTQRYAAMNDAGAQRAATLLGAAVAKAAAIPETSVTDISSTRQKRTR